MQDINLLPESRYNKRIIFRNILLFILTVAIMWLVVYLGIIEPLYNRRLAAQVLASHSAQMEKFKDSDAINIELNARLEELKLQKEGMAMLFDEKLAGSKLMAEIDASLPDGVQVIGVDYGEGTVALQGQAPSSIEVADFSIALNNTGLFESVRVLSIERDMAEGYHSFVMTLIISSI